MSAAICEGCGKGLGVVEASRWSVCLDCTKARHRTVYNGGRCTCRKKAVPTEVNRVGSRSWISCFRCLGQIRQLS